MEISGNRFSGQPAPGDSLPGVAAVLITRNAEHTIAATLCSLAGVPEVLVYDNGSSDRTIDIARRYPNVTVRTGPFIGFGPTRNQAAACASSDWILSVDADETVSPELMVSLSRADLGDSGRTYAVHRRNYFLGREVRHSGWGNDWLVRLYHRRTAGFDSAIVHEKVCSPGPVVRLHGNLDHQAVREMSDFLEKVNRYSELRRQQPLRVRSAGMIFLRSAWAFFRTYFVRLGVLDGWRGAVIAFSDANGVFFKHMKPWADERVRREQGRTRD